jgi:hypothetical protein
MKTQEEWPVGENWREGHQQESQGSQIKDRLEGFAEGMESGQDRTSTIEAGELRIRPEVMPLRTPRLDRWAHCCCG